jgi:hypothetical protein
VEVEHTLLNGSLVTLVVAAAVKAVKEVAAMKLEKWKEKLEATPPSVPPTAPQAVPPAATSTATTATALPPVVPFDSLVVTATSAEISLGTLPAEMRLLQRDVELLRIKQELVDAQDALRRLRASLDDALLAQARQAATEDQLRNALASMARLRRAHDEQTFELSQKSAELSAQREYNHQLVREVRSLRGDVTAMHSQEVRDARDSHSSTDRYDRQIPGRSAGSVSGLGRVQGHRPVRETYEEQSVRRPGGQDPKRGPYER